jgi:hypothetical protein
MTDLYSFGLLAWKIMLNGASPWEHISKPHMESSSYIATPQRTDQGHISDEEFEKINKPNDDLLDLALLTIQDRSIHDIDEWYARELFSRTVRFDPANRELRNPEYNLTNHSDDNTNPR